MGALPRNKEDSASIVAQGGQGRGRCGRRPCCFRPIVIVYDTTLVQSSTANYTTRQYNGIRVMPQRHVLQPSETAAPRVHKGGSCRVGTRGRAIPALPRCRRAYVVEKRGTTAPLRARLSKRIISPG